MPASPPPDARVDALQYVKFLEEDGNAQDVSVPISPLGVAAKIVAGKSAGSVVGDGAAAGTAVLNVVLAAGAKLIILKCTVASDLSAVLYWGSGAALAGAVYTQLAAYLPAAGMVQSISDGSTPIAVIDNSAGVVATHVFLTAPQLGMGVATNNDVNHHFEADYEGVLV